MRKKVELPRQLKNILECINELGINNDLLLKEILRRDIRWSIKKPYEGSNEEKLSIARKMYIVFGYTNSIELLSGRYGEIDYEIIHYLFNSVNVKGKNNEVFQEFFFNNKKDPNNIMRLMLEGVYPDILINFDYFYNNIEYFIEKLGTRFNKNKVRTLISEKYIAPEIENPEITGDELSDMISSYYSRYGALESEEEIKRINLDAYKKLKTKTKSSIMKVDSIEVDDYKFEVLPLTDFRNLLMGYRAGNCFRINSQTSFMLFNEFLTNPHMRILSISNMEYKDFGMVLLMRNGNILIGQGIEHSSRVPDELIGEKLYDAVRVAMKTIMDSMNNNGDEIVGTVMGLSNSNTANYNHNILPFLIKPISDIEYSYNGLYNYQGLLDLKEGKTISNMKCFMPSAVYKDDNNKLLMRKMNTPRDSILYRQIEKRKLALKLARFKGHESGMYSYYHNLPLNELYTICTNDWYITVYTDGTIDSYINSNDEDVIEDYNFRLEIRKKFRKD